MTTILGASTALSAVVALVMSAALTHAVPAGATPADAVPAGATSVRAVETTVDTVIRTVPATFEFRGEYWYTSGGTPQCAYATFVRWASVPGVTKAAAKYRYRHAVAADAGGPFADTTTERQPPYDNSYTFGASYQVDPGYDWIVVNWVSGGMATCADSQARQQRMVDQSAGATVELTIAVERPRVASIRGVQRLPRTRRAKVGTVQCPAGGQCTISVPKKVRVKIAGTVYKLSVRAPKVVRGGRTAAVTVVFPRAAADALRGAKVRPQVRVVSRNLGVAPTTVVVKRWVKS